MNVASDRMPAYFTFLPRPGGKYIPVKKKKLKPDEEAASGSQEEVVDPPPFPDMPEIRRVLNNEAWDPEQVRRGVPTALSFGATVDGSYRQMCKNPGV